MKINIIGAGMAGLLAANMLRRHQVVVFEKKPNLPNNHHAVLRFRSPVVGEALGIQFKKVDMMKSYVPYRNPIADSLSYSRKCTGVYKSDRSITEGYVIDERYIAPPDLIEQMSKNIQIYYDSDYDFEYNRKVSTISTIPMLNLMKLLHYPSVPIFGHKPGVVFVGRILACDAYVSVLFPGPEPYSRATITGDRLMIEFPGMTELPESYNLAEAYFALGLDAAVVLDAEFKKQEYFKIISIGDSERKKFQRWATVNHNVYSLGRYSTWRPKLLLDDLVNDIRKIESWITGDKNETL
jgi:hypothetical protein